MNSEGTSGPVVWLGIILVTCLLLVIFQTVLWLVLPILFSVVFYYLLSPIVSYGIAQGMTRTRAVMAVTILLTLFLIGAGELLAPKVTMAIHGLNNGAAQGYLQDGEALVTNAQSTLGTYLPFLHPHPAIVSATPGQLGVVTGSGTVAAEPTAAQPPAAQIQNKIADWTDRYSGGIALEVLHWIPSLLLIPYLTYFFLLDGPRFKRFLVQAIPNAFFEKTLFLFYRVENQLRSYFRGVLLLTLIDGFCLGVGLWFLGINAPFFLAAIAAVLAWLPYLGSIGGCLMVVLVAHHDFPHLPWLPYEAVGLFALVRMCDDFIFLPLTIGRSLRMHPLITVLMILLGGAVAGMSGLLLVMPVLGVVMVAGQIIGELLMDDRILARHRHVRILRQERARADL